MILMCKYSNEMITSIKAKEFKYFTIGLKCGEGNVLIAFYFHKSMVTNQNRLTPIFGFVFIR